jgi:hypothetical protein
MSGSVILRAGFSGGQFSDSEFAQESDAKRLAKRMALKEWKFLIGTEAGERSVLGDAWRAVDQDYGLSYHQADVSDVWIVTRADFFQGPVEKEWYKVLDAGSGHGERGYLRVTGRCDFVDSDLTILASHWLTKEDDGGTLDGPGNRKMADALTKISEPFWYGRSLCFLGLDANRSERTEDGIVLDAPFTSLATELDAIQNTGRGPIDALLSANADARVTGQSWEVFDDSEFFLSSDHYLCEGSWRIRF